MPDPKNTARILIDLDKLRTGFAHMCGDRRVPLDAATYLLKALPDLIGRCCTIGAGKVPTEEPLRRVKLLTLQDTEALALKYLPDDDGDTPMGASIRETARDMFVRALRDASRAGAFTLPNHSR